MDYITGEKAIFNCKKENMSKYPRHIKQSDFEPGGELSEFKHTIPHCLPIQGKIVKFIYGTEQVGQSLNAWIKLLTHLNELVGYDVLHCDCGQHLLGKIKISEESTSKKSSFKDVKKGRQFFFTECGAFQNSLDEFEHEYK